MKPDGTGLHVARSVERALALLDLVVSSGGISLTDAARSVGLPTSTALRHLKALELDGYVVRGEGASFQAGPRFVRLALTALDAAPAARLAQLARPHLVTLEEETGESAYLAVAEGSEHAVYVATQESRRAIRHVGWLGTRVPRDGSAVGAALAEDVDDDGVAVRTGAVEADVTAVAAPVYGPNRHVVAALSVIGPSGRMSGDELVTARRAVAAAARRMSTAEAIR